MLTDLQREIRRILTGLAECAEFALAGGTAIIVNGIADRPTNDLDFFTSYPKTVEALLNAAQAALEDEGFDVARLAEGATFARLSVNNAGEMTYVDLASDARMLPARLTEEGFVLAEPELAADKVLALAGRRESRDYIDFRGLLDRFDIDRLCELAGDKDPGFAPDQLTDALGYFDRIPATEFADYTDDYTGLSECVHAARQALQPPAREQPGRRRGLGL
ncbi:nucleotidyl transferase AbiEii/AbiGii toxin family protein [Candidatus Poriferisodalis sp.]|uniref:nucleotidyl transferase AbiEii/AbiGii toxin family protein n=1 Tax=Candidatus Poriferisodalis sp. TaxID=3101277 RepID=UPI003B59FD12